MKFQNESANFTGLIKESGFFPRSSVAPTDVIYPYNFAECISGSGCDGMGQNIAIFFDQG